MTRKGKSANNGELFIDGAGQLRLVEKSVEQDALEKGNVECLGLKFDSEDERRAHFTQKLREKLADPEFRKTPGFPKGADEDIIRMSDPPWYTACPNPFLADFVRVYGKPHDPGERYERDPFAVDTSVGKTDALYKAHGYHTKVPHLAIVPSILHYTEPGDVVLDGFSGSGMTGVAAQWCGSAPADYRKQLNAEWLKQGLPKPKWGARSVVLNDLSPAATAIAAGYNLPYNLIEFEKEAETLLALTEKEFGWMYETNHETGKAKGRIQYTVWSEHFTCPHCSGEIDFVKAALLPETGKIASEFKCPTCSTKLDKKSLQKFYETEFDTAIGRQVRSPKRTPAIVKYQVGNKTFQKKPDENDLSILKRIVSLGRPVDLPTQRMMDAPDEQDRWGDKWRAGTASFTHVHQLFFARTAQVLASMWRRAQQNPDLAIRAALKFWLDSHFVNLSIQNRYRPEVSFPYNPLGGVYYVSSAISEANPFIAYRNKLKRILEAFSQSYAVRKNQVAISTGDCACLQLPDNSVDYIFTDPPFGANFAYGELNFIVESWHRVFTNMTREAIVSPFQKKGVLEYQDLMRLCFSEYNRVLKPSRWITIVFSNSSNAVWRAIQEALGVAGFLIANVSTLDKQQGSFNQVQGVTVNQDLVISAYKPPETLSRRFALGASSPDDAWAFVTEHLGHVPVFSGVGEIANVIAERTSQMLHDRMVGFYVQRHLSVPLSTAEFLVGLDQRFPIRDGMYFLPTQVTEYDRKRNTAAELRQLSLFVTDEATAIQWVRRELEQKPRSFQDLQPAFMREIQNWAKHEKTIELKEILRQNCIYYDGSGPVPSQIHSYLSTNFKELRNLTKDNPALITKAADRWYFPDPGKQIDLDKIRERSLLSEFEQYKVSKERKLKLFRTEAVRAGFKAAYEAQDYKTIVGVAAKLPENVLQEDEKLLMYYDVASLRLGDE